MVSEEVLKVTNLVVQYRTRSGPVTAVDGVSFTVGRGEILGLAGESGSGKSSVAQAIARLPSGPTNVSGRVELGGTDLLQASADDLRRLRWTQFSLVTQSVMGALNPLTTIAEQFFDTFEAHGHREKTANTRRIQELLALVGLDAETMRAYPHQLSGGMRQRVGIALAMMFNPSLIIMDEPSTALDVVVERDLLGRIKTLQKTFGFSILFITHDLSLLFRIADRVAIMYAGEILEVGPVSHFLTRTLHPYSTGLVRSFPRITESQRRQKGIAGSPPILSALPSGCRFHPRCPMAVPLCEAQSPLWEWVESDRSVGVKCFRWKEISHEHQANP